MTKTKFVRKNWYGFDHEAVNNQFGGELTFINSFNIGNEYHPVTIYKSKSPDVSKGHKKYMLLQTTNHGGLVRGLSAQQMTKERTRSAIQCFKCDEVVFSAMRHDYSKCSCGNVFIDGGKDYCRYGMTDLNSSEVVTIDLLTGKVIK